MKTDNELFDEALVDLANKCIKAKKIKVWRMAITSVQIILVFAQLIVLKVGQNNNVNTVPYCTIIMLIVVLLFFIQWLLGKMAEKEFEEWNDSLTENDIEK